jgi:PST family polysaccharide transporter
LIVAKYLGPSALGYYGRAYGLMMLPIVQMSSILTTVLFPALSRARGEPGRFGRTWMLSTKASWVVGAPMSAGVATTAPALVETLYGARWLPMVTALVLLSASGPVQIIGSNTGPAFHALGRTGLHFKLGLVTSGLAIVAIVAGLPFGIAGIAGALLIKSWLSIWITLVPALRFSGIRVREFLGALAFTGIVTLLMAGLVLLVGLAASDWAAPLVLCAQVLAGAAFYITCLLIGERPFIRSLRGRRPA